ncbi:MAG: hypothetical protein K0V04_27445, partial [Deltaproteobacteria bacterium]|nr:hypothetical protein [Deltaproteobacteria bacterium]
LSQAEALLSDAIGRSGDQPCTRLAAVGTVSIVAARGGDRDGALRRRTVEALPTPSTCERWLRARVMAVRGDALVFGHRWCDAARAYADAYQAARSGWKPLVNWAEYTALCTWDAGTPRGRGEYDSALLEALVIDPSHTPREALSLAYLRWRLTDTVDDALRLLALFEAVPVSDVALAPDVASDLGPAVCAQQPACVYQWLTQPKRPGTTTVLRRALGLP